MMTTSTEQPTIYSISQLNAEAKALLEGSFASIWVEGEISNFAAPHSGHWYFSLKDARAQARCVMFKGHQKKVFFAPKDGLHVLVKVRISMYEARGEYQLIAEEMEERGEGKLRREFELLKKKLHQAGLFDAAHKKPLPLYPAAIGVVTSATGAAIRDILTVLKRRFRCAPVFIYPAIVQGASAAATIADAIALANSRRECDVLIVARGGGSLEDLWPFNEEIVAHAIFTSAIPIISGVGHEVDTTIADYVADVRAATPSAAAELITASCADLKQSLSLQLQMFASCMQRLFKQQRERIHWLNQHLQSKHPKTTLQNQAQALDYAESHLARLQLQKIEQLKQHLQQQLMRLQKYTPLHQLQILRNDLQARQQKLQNSLQRVLKNKDHALAQAAGKLDALSPLATLKRGYAIVSHNQKIIHAAAELKVNDKISIQLNRGRLACTIDSTEN